MKYLQFFAILPLAMVILAPELIDDADAYKRQGVLEETNETFYFLGQLTQSTENNPYGGEALGNYFIQVNIDEVKIISNLDSSQLDGKVMIAWLVDNDGKPAINLGVFEDNELNVLFQIDEWVYDVIVIFEVSDSFESPVGGDALEQSTKHKSNK